MESGLRSKEGGKGGKGCRRWRPSIMILLVVLSRVNLLKTTTAKTHVEAISACILGQMEIDLQAHTCTHFGAAVSQNADLEFSWWCQTTMIELRSTEYGIIEL